MPEVWWLDDGRAGHRLQTQALLAALEQHLPIRCRTLAPLSRVRALKTLLTGRSPCAFGSPGLIIGAGHATHLSLIALCRALSSKSLVLMRPSLPISWFDFAVVPRHDRPPSRDNCLATLGVLCPVAKDMRAANKNADCPGLILIGGPSRHCVWDQDHILGQVGQIVRAQPHKQWQLSTSPRTPDGFLRSLPFYANLQAYDVSRLPEDWLQQQFARSAAAWITPDSASMVYQGLSSGCACGVFDLQGKPGSKVLAGLDELRQQGRLINFADWLAGRPLTLDHPPLNEADRVAMWLIDKMRWIEP